MRCPFCDNEMTKGWVQSARRVLFTTHKNDGGFVIKDKSDVVLTMNNFFSPTAIAYHCKDCRKVVVDYAERSE